MGAPRVGGDGLRAGATVAALAVALRLVEAGGRLDRVVPAGDGGVVAEVARWLPWQLWDNVHQGRAPFDASVFVQGPPSLLPLVGNPGLAVLVAPLHAFGSAMAGAALGVLLVLVLNVFGGAMYGATRGVPWLGALAGASAWWVTGAASGHAAQVCFGPAALAAAAWSTGRRGLAVGLAVVAAVVAPAPSAAFLLGAGAWPLAMLAAGGLLAAPLGTWGASGVHAADVLWPTGRAARALPLALPLAAGAAWEARGVARVAAGLVALGLLLGVEPAAVGGFRLAASVAPGSGAALAAAVALACAAGLPLAARLVAHRRMAVGLLLAADAVGPLLLGGGAAWAVPAPLPEAFRALRATPRAGVVDVISASGAEDAGVGWISAHRQRAQTPPRIVGGGEAPAAPDADAVAARVRGAVPPYLVVLDGGDAGAATAYASRFGPPDETAGALVIWGWP